MAREGKRPRLIVKHPYRRSDDKNGEHRGGRQGYQGYNSDDADIFKKKPADDSRKNHDNGKDPAATHHADMLGSGSHKYAEKNTGAYYFRFDQETERGYGVNGLNFSRRHHDSMNRDDIKRIASERPGYRRQEGEESKNDR